MGNYWIGSYRLAIRAILDTKGGGDGHNDNANRFRVGPLFRGSRMAWKRFSEQNRARAERGHSIGADTHGITQG